MYVCDCGCDFVTKKKKKKTKMPPEEMQTPYLILLWPDKCQWQTRQGIGDEQLIEGWARL
jgi:hypothetical protein